MTAGNRPDGEARPYDVFGGGAGAAGGGGSSGRSGKKSSFVARTAGPAAATGAACAACAGDGCAPARVAEERGVVADDVLVGRSRPLGLRGELRELGGHVAVPGPHGRDRLEDLARVLDDVAPAVKLRERVEGIDLPIVLRPLRHERRHEVIELEVEHAELRSGADRLDDRDPVLGVLPRHADDDVEAATLVPRFGEASGRLEHHPRVLEVLRRDGESLELVGDAPRVRRRLEPRVLVQRDLELPRLLELRRRRPLGRLPHLGAGRASAGLLLRALAQARRFRRIAPALGHLGGAREVPERDEELDRAFPLTGLGEREGGLADELLLVRVEPADERGAHAERLHDQVPRVRVPLRSGEDPRRVSDRPGPQVRAHGGIDLPFLLELARAPRARDCVRHPSCVFRQLGDHALQRVRVVRDFERFLRGDEAGFHVLEDRAVEAPHAGAAVVARLEEGV